MEAILSFKMSEKWSWLDNNSSLKHYENSLKQLALTVHGLTFGRAYYQKHFSPEIWGGGGTLFSGGLIIIIIITIFFFFEGEGAYYRNFPVYAKSKV